tara:strand:+ start:151 stop:318 length:168 start_codon:yes stop_codon:yes gene_type:complete
MYESKRTVPLHRRECADLIGAGINKHTKIDSMMNTMLGAWEKAESERRDNELPSR